MKFTRLHHSIPWPTCPSTEVKIVMWILTLWV